MDAREARGVYDPVAQSLYVAYQSHPGAASRCFEYLDVPGAAWERMCDAETGWRYFSEAIQDRFLHFEVGKAHFETIYATYSVRCVVAASKGEPHVLVES